MFCIGGSLVILGWTVTVLGSVSSLGQVFLYASGANIVASTLGGFLTDKFSRLAILRVGQGFRFVGFIVFLAGNLGIFGGFGPYAGYSALNAIGLALNGMASAGVFQSLVPETNRISMAIRMSVLGQVGLAVGMGSAGFCLHQWGSGACIVGLIVTLVIQQGLIEIYTSGIPNVPSNREGFLEAWRYGISYVAGKSYLVYCTVSVALLYSVGQMTNLVVPEFVRTILGGGSETYGILEMSWSVGGVVVLAVATWRHKVISKNGTEFIILLVLGATMFMFGCALNVAVALPLYALMGALFSLGRAVCDGRILSIVEPVFVGRVRAVTSILTSVVGMIVYISPNLIQARWISSYYQLWGLAILITGLVFYGMSRKRSQGGVGRAERVRHRPQSGARSN